MSRYLARETPTTVMAAVMTPVIVIIIMKVSLIIFFKVISMKQEKSFN